MEEKERERTSMSTGLWWLVVEVVGRRSTSDPTQPSVLPSSYHPIIGECRFQDVGGVGEEGGKRIVLQCCSVLPPPEVCLPNLSSFLQLSSHFIQIRPTHCSLINPQVCSLKAAQNLKISILTSSFPFILFFIGSLRFVVLASISRL